jgi:hypothetical protein
MHQNVKCQIEVFLGSSESTEGGNSNGTSTRAMEEWKALKISIKSANVPKWAQRSQASTWGLVGGKGDGVGKRVMKCDEAHEATQLRRSEQVSWNGQLYEM